MDTTTTSTGLEAGYFFGTVIGIIIFIFFLISLHKAAKVVNPENRHIQPGMVWLNLIPLVSHVWLFFTATWLSKGLRAEASDHEIEEVGDAHKGLGITFATLNLTMLIPVVNLFALIPYFVVWIVYWVKISKLKDRIATQKA